MKQLGLTLFIFFVISCILTSCKNSEEKILVIDGWWDIDFAKNTCADANRILNEDKEIIKQSGCENVTACPELTKRSEACLLDNTGGIRDFESNLMTELASNPNCKSVHVIYFVGPAAGDNKEYDKVLDEFHYQLSLNFIPSEPSQEWQMTSSPKLTSYTKGTGTPQEIANKVCPIVIGTGAKLSN